MIAALLGTGGSTGLERARDRRLRSGRRGRVMVRAGCVSMIGSKNLVRRSVCSGPDGRTVKQQPRLQRADERGTGRGVFLHHFRNLLLLPPNGCNSRFPDYQ
ncbi:hypothetical protein [Salinisphaera dokdonensis]|uniref:hypothetical protein n=1 Tax=Salinisphaera dokdonensis TaxID=454598 RepID=UPI0033422FC6